MPRYFDSLADATAGIRGHTGRAAYATLKREARHAELNSPDALARTVHLRAAAKDHEIRNAIATAGDHLTKLRAKLAAAHRESNHMAATSYKTGDIHADAGRVRRQLDGLPSLIARAEQELADARAALDAHRAMVAKANSVELPQVDTDTEVEAVDEAPRGRGRPRKVAP